MQIKAMEYHMSHESMPIAEERQMVKHIKKLRDQRPRVRQYEAQFADVEEARVAASSNRGELKELQQERQVFAWTVLLLLCLSYTEVADTIQVLQDIWTGLMAGKRNQSLLLLLTGLLLQSIFVSNARQPALFRAGRPHCLLAKASEVRRHSELSWLNHAERHAEGKICYANKFSPNYHCIRFDSC